MSTGTPAVGRARRPGLPRAADRGPSEVGGVDPALIADAAFSRAGIGMAITDANGTYLRVNDELCAFLGFSPAEMLTKTFRDVTAPEDLDDGARAMQDLVDGRSESFSVDKRYVSSSGEQLWARTTGIAVNDANGHLLRVIVQIEDLTVRRAVEDALRRRESYDQLTDLVNRRLFFERLEEALRLPRRNVRRLALLVVNLDRFHQVNAGLGNLAGDRILREAGRRLRAQVRGDDTVARIGGDEFAVLALALRTPLDAVSLAIDVRKSLAKPYWVEGNAVYVPGRVGIVTDVEDVDAEAMVQMASNAALQAKSLAGGWSLHSAGSEVSSREELGLVSDLRQAILAGALTVAYQPIVDGQGRLCHLEALARWSHPDRGAVPPDQFIVLAEQNGLIADLTAHVLTTAVQQVATWRASGLPVSVAVNLSGMLLSDADLPARVERTLETAGVPPEVLTLEITETAFAEGSNPVIKAALDSLRRTGVRISIDDFGTGYSSLTYLKHLPVDELKIDQSFILDLDTDVRTERIVRSIIDLAHSLGLSVVAEGVEDELIAERLTAMGADALQGFVIARPSSAAAISMWMQNRPMAPRRPNEVSARRALNVLIVDAQPTNRVRLRQRLRANHHRVQRAHSCHAALSSIKRSMPDVVILDHVMPDTTGVGMAPRLREGGYLGPILLFSGSAPNDVAAVRFPMDVWPVSAQDDALLVALIDGYADRSPAAFVPVSG